MYRGHLSTRKVAALVEFLPRGASTWQMHGGPGAITAETEALWGVHLLQKYQMHQTAGNKGEAPQPPEYPEGVEADKSETSRLEANAAAWREKFGHKPSASPEA